VAAALKVNAMDNKVIKFLIVFALVLLAMMLNLGDNFLARMGLHTDYVYLILVALVIAALIFSRTPKMIFVVLLLVVASNVPSDYLFNIEIDRDYVAALMVAVVLIPYVTSWLDS
jgi:hypothetical protein